MGKDHTHSECRWITKPDHSLVSGSIPSGSYEDVFGEKIVTPPPLFEWTDIPPNLVQLWRSNGEVSEKSGSPAGHYNIIRYPATTT